MDHVDWENGFVRQELERHVRLVAPNVVGLLTTPSGRHRFAPALGHFTGGEVRVFDDPKAVSLDGLAVIVVAAEGQWPTLALRAQLGHLHATGLPIVTCTPERRFAASTPAPERFGLDYPGMFWVAGEYIPTVARGASYVEFGVFDGLTLTLAFHTLKHACQTFYAFDSFQGIGGTLANEQTHFADGQYAASLETLRYNLKFNNVDDTRVRVGPGFFQETLSGRRPADLGLQVASVVHIDTDLAGPGRLALEFITPALTQGSLLLFDDYDQLGASNDKGERRAVTDWLTVHPELQLEPYRTYGIFCRSFLLHRRTK